MCIYIYIYIYSGDYAGALEKWTEAFRGHKNHSSPLSLETSFSAGDVIVLPELYSSSHFSQSLVILLDLWKFADMFHRLSRRTPDKCCRESRTIAEKEITLTRLVAKLTRATIVCNA